MGVLEAAAGTRGDNGRLLGAAGDGGLFLGFGVLQRKRGDDGGAEIHQMAFKSTMRKGNEVPGVPLNPYLGHLEDASDSIWDFALVLP